MAFPRGEKVKLVFELEGYREYVAEVVSEPGSAVNVNLVRLKPSKEEKAVVEPVVVKAVERNTTKNTKTNTRSKVVEVKEEPEPETKAEPTTNVPMLLGDEKPQPSVDRLD